MMRACAQIDLLALSETMATLLGALGYSLLRISYLRFLRRIVATLRPQAQDTGVFGFRIILSTY